VNGRRVLVVAEHLSDLGGTEKLATGVAIALRRQGWEVTLLPLFRPRHARWTAMAEAAGVEVRSLVPTLREPAAGEVGHPHRRAAAHVAGAVRLVAMARLLAEPIVVFEPTAGLAVKALQLGLPRRATCVGMLNVAPTPASAAWFPADLPQVINRFCGLMVLSATAAEGAVGMLGYRGAILTVPPLMEAPTPVGPAPATEDVACVARLAAQKGLEYALSALCILRDRGHDCTLTVYGEGPDRGRLGVAVRGLGLVDNVRFAGQYESAPGPIAAQYPIFWQPSLFEGMPFSALEMLACGRPVVGSRVSGLEDMLPEPWTVPPGRPDAIADATEQLLADLRSDPVGVSVVARRSFMRVFGDPPPALRVASFIADLRGSAD
jgi:glycosyltransferase involved in cell wall biosynthesis